MVVVGRAKEAALALTPIVWKAGPSTTMLPFSITDREVGETVEVFGEENLEAHWLLEALRKARSPPTLSPIRVRLDSCQTFVDRARKRLAAAEEDVAKAFREHKRVPIGTGACQVGEVARPHDEELSRCRTRKHPRSTCNCPTPVNRRNQHFAYHSGGVEK